MRYEIDNKEAQDKAVSGWWNDDRTKKWHDFTYDKDNPLSHHLILRQKKVLDYLKLLKLPNGSKVLELGGGAGQTAKKICELGYDVTGIDISKHLCDESEKKCEKYVKNGTARFINQSMEKKFPINDDEFEFLGWHMYMTPEDAARGILIFDELPEINDDTGMPINYPDLSNQKVFS